jgi:hypothetical protein
LFVIFLCLVFPMLSVSLGCAFLFVIFMCLVFPMLSVSLVRIKIMCPSAATCILEDCCFSELALKIPIRHVGLVQRGHHYHLIECNLFSP